MNIGTIQKSCNWGRISATNERSGHVYSGGITGCHYGGAIENCYNTAFISSESSRDFDAIEGGIAGNVESNTSSKCCYSTHTAVFGKLNQASGSFYCYSGFTSEELLQESNFSGFDFENIWVIDKAYNRPAIRSNRLLTVMRPTYTMPSILTAYYSQTLKDIPIDNALGNTEGTWMWMDSSTLVGEVCDARTFKAIFIPDDKELYAIIENIDVVITVKPKTISEPIINIYPSQYEYHGDPIIPTEVNVLDGVTLVPNSEYILEVYNNTTPGVATVVIKDKPGGNYTVTGNATFLIKGFTVPTKVQSVSLNWISEDTVGITICYDGTYLPYWNVFAAIYNANGQMVSVGYTKIEENDNFETSLSFTLTVPERGDSILYAKVFTTGDMFIPVFFNTSIPIY